MGLNTLFFQIKNNTLLVTMTIYDAQKNLIAEVDSNKWRINKNLVSKFNFDEKGLEIFDNKGRIALSIDILFNNTIQIQGLIENDVQVLYLTENGALFTTPNENEGIVNFLKRDPYRQLFKYTGKKWHGVRNN